MFGFLKPKNGPPVAVEFRDDIVIEKPAEQVYALLDWADPQNAHRQRGSRIDPVEAAPGQFRMTMDELPGHLFEMTVTESVPHSAYGFTTITTPRLGRMAESDEQYRLEALSAGSCRLSLINSVTFAPMRPEEFGQEQLMVFAACHNALAKLKLQAEQGMDAVKAVADKWIV